MRRRRKRRQHQQAGNPPSLALPYLQVEAAAKSPIRMGEEEEEASQKCFLVRSLGKEGEGTQQHLLEEDGRFLVARRERERRGKKE